MEDYYTIRDYFFERGHYTLRISVNSPDIKPNFILLKSHYYGIFNRKYVGCSCEKSIKKMISKLDKHYEQGS